MTPPSLARVARWLSPLATLAVTGALLAAPGSGGAAAAVPKPAAVKPAAVKPAAVKPAVVRPTAVADLGAGSFVQRSGRTLFVNGTPMRFSGSNMYWLALDDNVRDASGQPTYPTQYRIDDAMTTAQASGGTVVRAWANTVGCARCIEPSLGSFNAAAFASLDYAVASAARHGQRLVLSLVDNWGYYHGGKLTYTQWRGKPESAFFADPQVIADYRQFITQVVTHVNPWTGVAYRDDPTIMAWETGNEMWCQTCSGNYWDGSWTRAVADHIKAVAPRQLVVDGHGTDPSCEVACLHEPSLDIGSVDLVDDHFYPMNTARVRTSSALAAKHGKGYLIGEYDWAGARGGSSLGDFLGTIESNPVSGDLLWATIPHADTTGFVNHDDGFQLFYPGRTPDQVQRSRTLASHATTMSQRGMGGVQAWVPDQVPLTSVVRTGSGVDLTWRGVAAAATYEVARTDGSSGWQTWTTLSTQVDDHRIVTGPTWSDTSGTAVRGTGQPTYRVRARALYGTTGPWSPALVAAPVGG